MKDLKDVGKSIVATSILGLVLLLIFQTYSILNYSNLEQNMTSLFLISLVGVFICGIVAETIVSKTNKPLVYGLASSTLSMAIIQFIFTTVDYFLLAGSLGPDLVPALISGIPLNIGMTIVMILVSGLGAITFWYFFSRNKEASFMPDLIKSPVLGYKPTLALMAILAIGIGITYLSGLVGAIFLWLGTSAVIAWIINKNKILVSTGKILGLSILVGIILAISSLALPLLVVYLLPDPFLLGLSINLSLFISFLILVFFLLSPVTVLEGKFWQGIGESIRLGKKRFFEILGLATLLYLWIFAVEILVGLASLTWENPFFLLALEIIASSYSLVFAVNGIVKIKKIIS